MDLNLLKNISFILAAVWITGAVVRKYRRFFEWKKTDDWQTFIQRALEEQQKDTQAQRFMFGSLGATNRANLITLFVLLCLVFLVARAPEFSMWIIGYLVIGVFASHRAADDAKTVEHQRLLFADRLWMRMYFALGWPYWFLFRNDKKKTN